MKAIIAAATTMLIASAAFSQSADLERAIDKVANDETCAMRHGSPYDEIAAIGWENLEVAAKDAGLDPSGDEYEIIKVKIIQIAASNASSTLLDEYCENLLTSGG